MPLKAQRGPRLEDPFGLLISAFRQLSTKCETDTPAMRMGDKGYTQKSSNVISPFERLASLFAN